MSAHSIRTQIVRESGQPGAHSCDQVIAFTMPTVKVRFVPTRLASCEGRSPSTAMPLAAGASALDEIGAG
jgi:hypothetical protein